jgi:pimeloyl-ACP methyl ester carboxylesterase
VLYRTNGAKGAPTTASGTVLVPKGPAPQGGWPVVSWAHGTVGVADRCAPSQSDNLFYNEYAQEARSFLAAGYAVVATDYPGLGTPGAHPYLDGRSEGNAVVDIVPAAHQLFDTLAPEWFAVGHSQGGQAVLYATKVAATRAQKFPLTATVAIAPASHLELLVPTVAAGDSPADFVYALYALAGLSAVDGDQPLKNALGPEGITRMEQITTNGCLVDNYKDFEAVPADGVFDLQPAEMTEVSKGLGEMGDPDRTRVTGPVLVVQGATDADVPAAVTAPMAQHLKELGSDVTYREYPGRNHDQVLGPSVCDQLQFLADHGGRPATGCVPYETDLT